MYGEAALMPVSRPRYSPPVVEHLTRGGTDASSILDDPIFHVCWRRQSCSSCLTGDVGCSWCAISSTCVPNPVRLPILAPIRSANICPLGSEERWELRALPFGCRASTLTVISVIVAVLGTLAAIGVGYGALYLVKSVRHRWKRTGNEHLDRQRERSDRKTSRNWLISSLSKVLWKSRSRRTQGQEEVQDNEETRPLLE
ncbi:uncharacterized protein N7482_005553 [Penicillium canariense]|uniref:PSI domain-containing protein n=1 Tax=Penicillium canariense TaxID=189055 RepID=A0A9W9I852_9EURO|nr:uncharacterized protein N7482_005553 [Penicillium canariense]KAJ5166772.1 hypothetical protein N7482_005553 [Penicillium canariense]